MVRPLQILLEREFSLWYYGHGTSIEDLRKLDSRKLEWYYRRLYKQLSDERDEIENLTKSKGD